MMYNVVGSEVVSANGKWECTLSLGSEFRSIENALSPGDSAQVPPIVTSSLQNKEFLHPSVLSCIEGDLQLHPPRPPIPFIKSESMAAGRDKARSVIQHRPTCLTSIASSNQPFMASINLREYFAIMGPEDVEIHGKKGGDIKVAQREHKQI